jgi:hypothetical protein
LAVVIGVGLTGCEWEGGGDDNSWNTSSGVANFSGTYEQPGGGYVVSLSTSTTGTNYVTATQQIGTGNGVTKHFEGVLSHTPVVQGSVNLIAAAGSVSLTDSGGALTGTGGSGSINYGTGFVAVNCTVAPGAATPVNVTYSYPATFAAGEDSGISTLNVQQEGNAIRIIDNHGKTYSGTLSGTRTGSGAAIADANDGDTVSSQFEASGVSAAGRNVRMVGTFTAAVTGTAPDATMTGQRINGTWIEAGGDTAGISGSVN